MNKQEMIEKIEKEKSNLNAWEDLTRNRALNDALAIVRQLDEPEKVVVSKLEAEWLDKLKAYYRHREDRLYVITRQGWGNDFCFSCHGEQIELSYEPYKWKEDIESVKRRLVNAILYGYEVEKEKLYTVEIPNPNIIGNEVNALMMNGFRQVVIKKEFGDNWKKEKGFQLTEVEIKKDFDWAWQFAEDVEE
jgi:hypothetical protein